MIYIDVLLFFYVILLSTVITTTATTTNTTTQDQIDRLSKIDQENILKLYQSTPSLREALVDQAENWCCKTDPGVEATLKSRQTTFYITQVGRHKCGYVSCGFLGMGRCTRWCTESWAEMHNGVETYLVYTKRVCSNEQITCCAQNIYVLGHCISYTEVYNNQQLLAQLHELGIVFPGPHMG